MAFGRKKNDESCILELSCRNSLLSKGRVLRTNSIAVSPYDVTPLLYVCLARESRMVVIKLKSHDSFKSKFDFQCAWVPFVFHLLILC